MTSSINQEDIEALEQASDWLVRLNDDACSSIDRKAWEQWRHSSSANERAWLKAEALINKMGGLPKPIAMSALNRPASRRSVVNKLLLATLTVPITWGGWRVVESQALLADHATRRGEQKSIHLADGTEIRLNTDSAIQVQFTARTRLIRLVKGEIIIQTNSPTGEQRPFKVQTEQGMLVALGTSFNVRQRPEYSSIAVLEGAVRIEPKSQTKGEQLVLSVGERTDFTSTQVYQAQTTPTAELAWVQGMIMADNMSLVDFVAELSRYHSGWLRVADDIAGLRISGAYPATNLEKTLGMLTATYPLQRRRFVGEYWQLLEAKP